MLLLTFLVTVPLRVSMACVMAEAVPWESTGNNTGAPRIRRRKHDMIAIEKEAMDWRMAEKRRRLTRSEKTQQGTAGYYVNRSAR